MCECVRGEQEQKKVLRTRGHRPVCKGLSSQAFDPLASEAARESRLGDLAAGLRVWSGSLASGTVCSVQDAPCSAEGHEGGQVIAHPSSQPSQAPALHSGH